MRFLFVGGALCGGGAERQLFQLATALHALGHQVTVATIAQSDLATEFRHVPLRTGSRRNKVGAVCGIAGALVRLCRLCMSERPHVLIGWQTVPLILASAVGRYCRTPFVAAIRSSGSKLHLTTRPKLPALNWASGITARLRSMSAELQ